MSKDDMNMAYLNIRTESMNKAINKAENALSQCDLDNYLDELNEGAIEELKECGDWNNITNSVISAYFSQAKSIIERFAGEKDVDYFVNDYDSHFVIDGEEVCE